jgi:putative endonuclease
MGRRPRSAVGMEGEQVAAQWLEGQGYRILARNVRFRIGELDLVAEEGGVLVFVEVKTRRSTAYGTAAEAVTRAKQERLVRLAHLFLSQSGRQGVPCRFDVVSVTPSEGGGWDCTLIRDAFGER